MPGRLLQALQQSDRPLDLLQMRKLRRPDQGSRMLDVTANAPWLTELDSNRPDIDWTAQGDPLIEYLRAEISIPITLSDWRPVGHEDPGPFSSYGHVLYSETLASRLVFAFFQDRIRVLIETPSRPENDEDLEPWRSAYNEARRRLSEAEPEFRWWAAIGPHPGRVADVPRVVNGVTVGNINVSSASFPYVECIDGRTNPHLAGATVYSSYPLAVHGKTSAYSWEAAAVRATHELNSVCAILSVEFDGYWSVRNSVAPYGVDESGEFPELKLPQRSFGIPEEIAGEPGPGNVRDVTIPNWIGTALEKVQRDNVLYSSVHSHRQGLSVIDEHPSLALVCFVSAIEGIGATLEELSVCSHCGMKKGASRRFRAALKTALSRKEVNELQSVYDLRSETAHSGVLHGEETQMGNLFMPMKVFAPLPESFNFRYRSLWRLQCASKRVLTKYLAG